MKKVSALIVVALLVGLFFGFLWGRSLIPLTQIVSSDSVAREASLMIDYGDGKVRVYPDITVTAGETMIQFLEKQATKAALAFKTKDFKGLGLTIETIGDKTNGDDNNYWQYWVNNVSIPYAASTYIVKPGDVVEWKFLHYK